MTGQSKKGDKQYVALDYVNAIQTYDRLVAKNISNPEMLEKLGNSYYFNADLLKAGSIYKILFDQKVDLDAEYYYRYSQCLKAAQNYQQADEMLTIFNQKSGNEVRAKLAMAELDYLNIIKKNSGRFIVEDAGINSKFSDYGSSFYKNKLVFASSRKKADINENYAAWTGEKFTDLYAADMDLGGNLSKVTLMSSVINSKFHESTPVFTKDGNTVYFTRNNYFDNKRKYSAEKTTLLKIYKATFNGKKWSTVVSLPFNSDNYQVAHPTLSPDEKTLYFASDMPGTIGQSDLFKVEILGNDTYGTPVNLGNKINTEGRETFPFLSDKNELYFASDGHPGLGGLDVFSTKLENNLVGTIVNMGTPINSPYDDFSFVIDSSGNHGYVSSNRAKGNGNDDIYKVTRDYNYTAAAVCEQSLVGVVTDQESGNTIKGVKVVLFDSTVTQVSEQLSDANGKFDFGSISCGGKFYVRTSINDYVTTEVPVLATATTGITYVPVVLSKMNKAIKVGDDLAKLLDISSIYFDLNKSYIRKDAAIELSKIVDVMQQNVTLKIEVRSHTDSRDTAQYNADLSERRAKSTIAWLINKGIDKSRLIGRGFGESRLLNGCTDGVKCSEVDHQLNRRSEFIIVK